LKCDKFPKPLSKQISTIVFWVVLSIWHACLILNSVTISTKVFWVTFLKYRQKVSKDFYFLNVG
jgi:hypothetical protein